MILNRSKPAEPIIKMAGDLFQMFGEFRKILNPVAVAGWSMDPQRFPYKETAKIASIINTINTTLILNYDQEVED